MLCWGSWGNTQKLASKKWPFQLFYWDYSIGILVLTLSLAFSLGSFGEEGRSFLEDLQQSQWQFLWYAFVGGVIFNFSNLLLVVAIDIAGMAVAFPIGVGIALVLGVTTNFIYDPQGNPEILFTGVGLIALAIILDAIVYNMVAKSKKKSVSKGILISVLAGIAMGFFYKYVALSMAPNFTVPEDGMLTPYTALVIFAIGIFISNFIFNSIAMYKPIMGKPVGYRDYFRLGTPKIHIIGVFGGVIWGIGMALSILASEQAGLAISYGLGQGATLIAALWGIFVWKELKDLPSNKNWILFLMFLFFITGLGLIVYSKIV